MTFLRQAARKRPTDAHGFTVMGTMISFSLLALAATLGVQSFSKLFDSGKRYKLQADVSRLNAAVKVYQASGGDLSSAMDPQAVIDRLKASTATAQRNMVIGLRDAAVDQRLAFVMQTSTQAASDQARVVWESDRSRFRITYGGDAGIREFTLDESLVGSGSSDDCRDTVLNFADSSGWIWDYNTNPGAGTVTQIIPEDLRLDIAAATTEATNAPSGQLASPQFSAAPGSYPITEYGFAVALIDPNPTGMSEIRYSVSGGLWEPYDGTPIEVEPGTSITAMAVPSDGSNYQSSEVVHGNYTTTTVKPVLALTVPSLSVTYAAAGGAMVGGVTTPNAPVQITLANFAAIPTEYQNASRFVVRWTYDGGDPLYSATSTTGAAFSGGFTGQTVDYSPEKWGGVTTLPIKAAAKSKDPMTLSDSRVVSTTLTIYKTTLGAPTISNLTIGGGTQSVTISLPTAYGNLPVGARIYYTTDGVDPGADAAGNPVTGTLYGGPFDLDFNAETQITARVYGPLGHAQWFTPSPAATVGWVGADLLIIDEDALDIDISSIIATADEHGVSAEWLLNKDNPTTSGNPWLRWSTHYGGDEIWLPIDGGGDPGWFRLPTATPWHVDDYTAGTVPPEQLDQIAGVQPLLSPDLNELVGGCFIAVVYDSDISLNTDLANLQGARLGRLAVTILGIAAEDSDHAGQVRVRIDAVSP